MRKLILRTDGKKIKFMDTKLNPIYIFEIRDISNRQELFLLFKLFSYSHSPTQFSHTHSECYIIKAFVCLSHPTSVYKCRKFNPDYILQ